MTKRCSRLLFLTPPPGTTTGVLCAEARRSIDIRITRSYILVPVRGGAPMTAVGSDGECSSLSGWQHLTVPGDLQVHATKEVPKAQLPLCPPWSDANDWRTLIAVVAQPSVSDTAMVAPEGQSVTFGPGVLVVAPDAPTVDERWRLMVEILAGPPATCDYPPPPFDRVQPIPMHDGNVVFREEIKKLLPKARRPASADIAFRGSWTVDGATRPGISIFTEL